MLPFLVANKIANPQQKPQQPPPKHKLQDNQEYKTETSAPNIVHRKIDTYESEITVEFDEHKCSKYPYAKLDEIELAYAITIHKSQGSEYPVVILPLLSDLRSL